MDQFHKIFMETHGPMVETDEKQTSQKCGNICPMHQTQKNKSGHMRNQSLTIPKDYVVFVSLILMMRNSRISLKITRRKLEIPMPIAKTLVLLKPTNLSRHTTLEQRCTVPMVWRPRSERGCFLKPNPERSNPKHLDPKPF